MRESRYIEPDDSERPNATLSPMLNQKAFIVMHQLKKRKNLVKFNW